ncbi:MAG: tRNA 2-thiouridine(34) synthase MnmA [Candidatus Lambdaproteobacteria bacterium RIFOXYD1_FULL_56_27]|uniref:tRNA-specific 2-thiouridylase MnmA n=1 Tax=Candidatus Lambdaproteobacteria bacterium RIFOXYD2_FULL_56_26 TaxID=1817773 RepID=A0A1F6H3E7_9PROT|nr:MAG: tRNA 2-thiouridine(34) synthase MnmA [Candidatus Lambdaproteobacteria bacterium RIFOXYC1_FULL_56_13]OGH04892.1 MAG: tRNA 2-thiouridine(34) synthase MnmA [Candidatus Lambdaproteobacteria bacterium RIFOXYD2_FULL_56_26]OGH09357.1 MAG: tRNA 2-thiouridine(34) synthase MnmA [Candidatus Lambdaproteobacteria bacterium RIFOXYD1_FULL_56_27]
MKVVVGMSGGVDSSVAAALLVQQGHEVIGLMLKLWAEEGCRDNRCCAPEAVDQARSVARQLGIPFYVLDYKQVFKQKVVDPFVGTYLAGATPNPCLSCNRLVRFGAMMEEALALGADKLVTGHYVRLEEQAGRFLLKKGLDPRKDQSYVLYQLSQAQLARCLFPLGGMEKSQTRALAKEFGLEVASKPDSQDLCFVGDDGYRGFLARRANGAFGSGNFVDTQGRVLGRHKGLPLYTIGQRKGLGLSLPEPLYVVRLDRDKNQVVLGRESAREASLALVDQLLWQQDPGPYWGREVAVQVRYNSQERFARLEPHGPLAKLHFLEPVKDLTPGQAAVFYDGDLLVGGGILLG